LTTPNEYHFVRQHGAVPHLLWETHKLEVTTIDNIRTDFTMDTIKQKYRPINIQDSDPKLTTLDVKPLGPSAAREIGTFSLETKGPTPEEVTGKYLVVWEKIGSDWKLAADIWNDGK
jgi:ketosteroid isomerase-like protein